MTKHVWGDEDTKFFHELTPDRILDAVEASGYQCTGRCMALNSMENRVYEVEIVVDSLEEVRSPSDRFRIAKFYRPGRWSKEQILEEHEFLLDLLESEISVVAPLRFEDGRTLRKLPHCNIWYALFPKHGGRAPDELNNDQLVRLGMLLARLHNVGNARKARSRIHLTPATYGMANLQYLLETHGIPSRYTDEYKDLVERICEISAPWFEGTPYQRIHGDCHLGNLLWRPEGPVLLDFDDMVMGPCVQDIWLLVPGRDQHALEQREKLLNAYGVMREFDRRSLRLIEPLRALRFVHFSAWISKRWMDRAFQMVFPHFGTERYWAEQVQDLREQLQFIQETAARDQFCMYF